MPDVNVLFLHRSFPAQFVHLAAALRGMPGCRVVAITAADNASRTQIETHTYAAGPDFGAALPRVSRTVAASTARGACVAEAMARLAADGFVPDVVIGHVGWGETLFVRDVWPDTRIIALAEFFYAETAGDIGFDTVAEIPPGLERKLYLRMENAAMQLALADADAVVVATRWQASRFPQPIRDRITVLHEGIDTDRAAPDPAARFTNSGSGLAFTAADEVVTFVNRNLEPYRGYHVFMQALPEILMRRPRAHAVLVGGDGVSYGLPPPGRRGWKDLVLDEMRERLPPGRVHFAGRIAYPAFLALMQISAAHVYLTYPFILSWSLLEAMSVGAPIVASRTPPVEEVVAHGRNGLLVDFFDRKGLAAAVSDVLARPGQFRDMRSAARETVVNGYDLRRICLPGWLALIERVTGRRLGSGAHL